MQGPGQACWEFAPVLIMQGQDGFVTSLMPDTLLGPGQNEWLLALGSWALPLQPSLSTQP